ncbi:MAG: helicase HerA-like domain-containing protein, partial [Myxococcota bacterium]
MARPVNLGPRAVRTNDGKWERGEPVELDADALVRHAFVCGASGAGKTVFSKGLVEEAALAGIPVVAVDLKGDLASLALTGAHADPAALAAVFGDEGPAVAAEYRAGAERHGVDAERARRYADQACVRLFTPNSSLGRRVALSALPSFPDPPGSALEREERDELIQALVLGFAHSMYGSPAAVKKNEPAVKVVEELVRWCANRGEPLEGAAGVSRILELVREPPFDAMGGMPLEQYLPLRDKQRLMQKLNSRLLGAERSRYEGPRLSIETLLEGVPAGKTPLSIVYLGHISDFTEQASILGLLCADVYRWMRKTGGSSGTRLLLYVDELGGGDAKHAFYPSAPHNPPSKAPLNLLVRQGRSAGVAMLLATQNPMSVDVRGLGNINTWAIGRLTRKNDHARIEDLLARLPEGPPTPTQVVSQLPQGVMLAMSDALSGPTYVFGRWLYSVHRQLSPGAVGTISQLTDHRPPEPIEPPPAARPQAAAPAAPSPPAADLEDPPADIDPE